MKYLVFSCLLITFFFVAGCVTTEGDYKIRTIDRIKLETPDKPPSELDLRKIDTAGPLEIFSRNREAGSDYLITNGEIIVWNSETGKFAPKMLVKKISWYRNSLNAGYDYRYEVDGVTLTTVSGPRA